MLYTKENIEVIPVKELLTYIAQNVGKEPAFLNPTTLRYVEIIGLLDEIAKLRGVSKEDNDREYNQLADSL